MASTNLNRHRVAADEWAKTIVAFQSPHRFKDLLSPQGEARQAEEIPLDLSQFKIRLAHSDDRKEASSLLIHKMYSWRGYEGAGLGEHDNPNRLTLVASLSDQAVGTISINLDSAQGLPADEVYKDKLDVLRARSKYLCEPTKLAVDERIKSKRVLGGLMHIAFIYAHRIHKCTDYVIEVNPRHADFYKRMMGFEDLGEERNCPRVSAPAVLLTVSLLHYADMVEKWGGQGDRAEGEKSFFPYHFSKADELGIMSRLFGSGDN